MSNVKSGLEALQLVASQIESLAMEKKSIDARIAELRGREEEIRASIFAEMTASQEKVLNIVFAQVPKAVRHQGRVCIFRPRPSQRSL